MGLAAKILGMALDNLDRARQLARLLPSGELPKEVTEVLERLEESATLLDETSREAVVALGTHVNHPELKAQLAAQRQATLDRFRKRITGQ